MCNCDVLEGSLEIQVEDTSHIKSSSVYKLVVSNKTGLKCCRATCIED